MKREIIEKVRDVEGIEKIIWAYSGMKKCSDFQIKDRKDVILSVLDSLGLDYDGKFIKVKNWPSWKDFARKYHKDGDYMFDLASGLFYDIPYCCSEAYQKKTIESLDKFFVDYPFKGKNTLKEVLELSEESASFYDELRKHEEVYGFKEDYDEMHKIGEETVRLILSGKFFESLFLLLGQTYVPCKANCDNFLVQSEKMLNSLKTQLGEEQAIQILKKYKMIYKKY